MLPITLLSSNAEREACARIMATSEPWLTLGYTYADLRTRFDSSDVDVYVLKESDAVAGFAMFSLRGVLPGYLQSIAIDENFRGRGYGTQLMQFVEERIFRERPNVFLFVSSFNHGARKLYESLGYETIGVVKIFLVQGYDEVLMRKTVGPMRNT